MLERNENHGEEILFSPSRASLFDFPFPHRVYDDFFTPKIYAGFCREFDERLKLGLHESPTPFRFSRSGAQQRETGERYDAYTVILPAHLDMPLAALFSRQLHHFMEREFNQLLTPDILAAFHHHPTGSRDGFVHTDFHICNFLHRPRENGLNPFSGQVSYQGAWDATPGVHHCYRSIAAIIYLQNPPWSEGDGGETALFTRENHREPAAKIAPLNNRLLAFEVSPR